MSEPKTSLTAEEKIRAAAAKLMYGTTDAEIALILGVTNHGRVNEAIKEILGPLGLTAPGYKDSAYARVKPAKLTEDPEPA
jgi:hypothetical protein